LKPIKFMGQEFADVLSFRKVYPAFCGNDAIRAIRAGRATPMEVEQFCWEHRNQDYLKMRAAAQRKNFRRGLVDLAKSPKRKRKAA
jgi:hypothetical protein